MVVFMRDPPLPSTPLLSSARSSLLSHRVLSRPLIPLLQHAAASSVVLSSSLMSPSEPCVRITDGWDDVLRSCRSDLGESDPVLGSGVHDSMHTARSGSQKLLPVMLMSHNRWPSGGRRPACGRASGIEARMRVLWIDTMLSLPVAAVLLIATAVANGVTPSQHFVPAVSIAHDHDSAIFGRALAFASGSTAAPPVSGVTARSLPFATPRLV
jgi:hypothetical protein